MYVYPKFIIETFQDKGDCLILAKCTYHKDLARNVKNVKGGGWWRLDNDNLTFILEGESHDFGRAKIEDIINCIQNEKVFSSHALVRNLTKDFIFKYKNEYGELINLNEKQK